jgi:cellulose synthase/poly-beta-1,6-N-acetylglucosamine synthase-like glycosyltransferase
LPHKGCFSQLISRLQVSNVGIVCGRPAPTNHKNSLVGRLVQLLWRFHDHVFKQLNDAGLARHATEIFCFRKSIADKIPPETINDDAYLAVIAKKKGWLIGYEPKSVVSICGPQTFLDYVRQRRRIVFGHYQIRKLTGESPQYLVHLMPLYPTRVLKLVSWLCTEYDPLTLLTFMLIELMVNAVAIIDFVLRKSHVQWSVSPSTKKVSTSLCFPCLSAFET